MNLEFTLKQWDEEIQQGHFSSTFRPGILPCMYSMPIGVVPEPHSTDLQLVTHHSASEHVLNNIIAWADSSIKLDGSQDFSATLHVILAHHGCPPAWLFKSNVSATYCQIPMHPLWQIKQTNTFKGLWHVDFNMAFRTHTAPKFQCTFYGLVMWITIYARMCADLMHYIHGQHVVLLNGPSLGFLSFIQSLVLKETGQTTWTIWWIGTSTCEEETALQAIPWDHQPLCWPC